MIRLTNTLGKQKTEFIPRAGQTVKMFVCGPTVYDYIHIGNARTFVFFDVVAKYLRQRGYQTEYLQNITDIDDKIIARAAERDKDPAALAQEYTEIFREDMLALGVTAVDRYAKATDHIKEVVAQVQELIDTKHAYLIESDGWYFDLTTFPEYGKLSGRTAQMADDAVSRIDENDKKRNRGDFCLWKFSKAGEPSWESELGPGRPGWHIEDTAITEKYFGPQYDLHGGGMDLIFPHHEAELAQQEAVSGLKPFVKYWMHVAFLVNKDQKMSKSLRNFATLHNLLDKYTREVLRFYLLSAHYRSPLDFSDEQLKAAGAAVARIGEFIERLTAVARGALAAARAPLATLVSSFNREMDDDFNTPQALAIIFETVKTVNAEIDRDQITADAAKALLGQFSTINAVLGIVPTSKSLPAEIEEKRKKIENLRAKGNYAEADEIRNELLAKGYQVQDAFTGTTVIAGIKKTSE